jgi:hypothetical protein
MSDILFTEGRPCWKYAFETDGSSLRILGRTQPLCYPELDHAFGEYNAQFHNSDAVS